ncbi:MAG TPA: energy transducer TonB, partial [Bryobacteraceae bacterium]|nr:energy transducer TonB [Bryobacteraceae bacterium]
IEYGRGNRAWTTMAGLAGQVLIVTSAVLAPLVGPQSLPRPQEWVTLFYPTAPVAPPTAAPHAAAVARPVRPAMQLRDGQLIAPTTIPARPAIIEEPPLTAAEMGGIGGGVPGGVESGIPGGIPHGLADTIAGQVAPPAPARPAAPTAVEKPAGPPARIKVGGNVQQGMLLHQVTPVYPTLARQARISGIVQLVGVVGTDGRIKHLQLVSGHPLLVQAALAAVRQWVYRPTYLNGDAVEVVAPITVSFVMQ